MFPTGKATEQSDAILLERVRDGDNNAATELYVRYAHRLQDLARSRTSASLASRVDPEDVVQSVFRTFFRRAAEGFFEVPPGDEIWNLMLVIALNKIRRLGNFHRRKKRDIGATQSSAALGFDGASAEDTAPLTVLQMSIDELLHEMTPAQRQMVQMRIAGHGLGEIAAETRRSTRTIERTLKQFRNRLSSQIHDE